MMPGINLCFRALSLSLCIHTRAYVDRWLDGELALKGPSDKRACLCIYMYPSFFWLTLLVCENVRNDLLLQPKQTHFFLVN